MKKLTLILSMMIALVGFNANAAMYIVGNVPFGDWNPGGGVEMTNNGDGTYTYTTTITGSVYFVFGDGLDGDWDVFNADYRYGPANGNETVTTNEWMPTQKAGDHGSYLIHGNGEEFTFIFDEDNQQFMVEGEGGPIEITSYTVVGPGTIFGTNWDKTDVNNDMVKGADGVYTWSKENVTLYGNFDFKVVGNHDYDIYQWPIVGNWTAHVAEEGIYTIDITFDPEADDADRITCTLTKTSEVGPIVHTYTVAGTQNVFGSDWNPADEANDMVKGADGIYTWTKNGVELAVDEEVKFKVVQDHSCDYAWPSRDWYYKCEEAGAYNIVITFDPTAEDAEKITFSATLGGEPEFTRGDVDGNGEVKIADVTTLINYLLTGNAEGVNLQAADCDQNGEIKIGDVTTLINFLLSGNW